ncbi:MAG: hypothetical protein M3440_05400, partial [Chloroflexota bacterium]|nr:hypothetical protein [Chloroflexota bacterium]
MIRVKVKAAQPHTSRVIDHLIEQGVLLVSDDQEYDLEKTPEVQQLLAAERIMKVSEYDTVADTETLEVTFDGAPEPPAKPEPDPVTAQLGTAELSL